MAELENNHRFSAACPNPRCGRPVDAAAGGSHAPAPGDLMVCYGCACVQIVNDDGHSLRLPTPADEAAWGDEDREAILELQEVLRSGWTPSPTQVDGGGRHE